MKKEKSQQILQKYKKPLENTINNYMPTIWQPRRNVQLSRDLGPAKTESRRNKSTEQNWSLEMKLNM